MSNDDFEILLIDEKFPSVRMEKECEEFKPIMKDFMESYAQNKDKPVDFWLKTKLQECLPEKNDQEIQKITDEIITAIQTDEDNKASLQKAVHNGRSKENWFASQIQKITSLWGTEKTVKHLNGLDHAIEQANESLYQTIHTKAGNVSQNPHLDGFIAEDYHAQTFNLNAQATGSDYRAKVLKPEGTRYAKNSPDIEIVDGQGKVVKRYQSKYCKDAKATAKAFDKGDYHGQKKLVPDGQQSQIKKRVSNVIKAPDGAKSDPLPKSSAVKLKEEAQSGNWNELNWNEYKTKDLAIGIGKQAGYAAVLGAAVGVGFDVAQKLYHGEEIKGEEVVEAALVSGADFGVKAAAAGALKVGVEKEVITVISKGTPASTIANIAFVAVEDAKVIGKMATGELSTKEGFEKIEQTTVATVAGLAVMAETAEIGAAIGTFLGPVGTAVGGFVGGAVGYMAGSKVGETVVKEAQKMRKKAIDTAKKVFSNAKNTAYSVKSGLKNFGKGLKSAFSW